MTKLKTYANGMLYTWCKLLLAVMFVFGPIAEVLAQRIIWGVMWNGATVPIPELIRYNASPSLSASSSGVPSVAQLEATHLRYWNRNDRQQEFSIQFSTHQDNYTATDVMSPMFMVSYGGYWNY